MARLHISDREASRVRLPNHDASAADLHQPDVFTNGGRPFTEWPLPPDDLKFKSNEVHVWATRVDLPVHLIERCLRHLTTDEQERAERYYFIRDRNRFIAARFCLRALLSGYLKVKCSDIRFSYNEYGKPSLTYPGNQNINFNLAHSGDLAIYPV